MIPKQVNVNGLNCVTKVGHEAVFNNNAQLVALNGAAGGLIGEKISLVNQAGGA